MWIVAIVATLVIAAMFIGGFAIVVLGVIRWIA